jgi:hypothetical protein
MTDLREGNPNCDNAAVMQGYTRHVIVVTANGLAEFAALVRPEADLDDSFKCFDTDNQQWLTVHGWLADSITDAE